MGVTVFNSLFCEVHSVNSKQCGGINSLAVG